MGLSTVFLRCVIVATLSAVFIAVANSLGLSLTLDRTQFAVSVAIVVGCVLTYGKLLRMSSKRG